MPAPKRFQDKQFTLKDFYGEVDVVCLACGHKALAKADYENHLVNLICGACSYNRRISNQVLSGNWKGAIFTMSANGYFGAEHWYRTSFRGERFWAYSLKHLEYLEDYIASGIRENPNRTRFTMVEKLPKFMQVAKNREALLKLIGKLKLK